MDARWSPRRDDSSMEMRLERTLPGSGPRARPRSGSQADEGTRTASTFPGRNCALREILWIGEILDRY